eukprot:4404204-Alexandrium_andersonii.AAC.1
MPRAKPEDQGLSGSASEGTAAAGPVITEAPAAEDEPTAQVKDEEPAADYGGAGDGPQEAGAEDAAPAKSEEESKD